MNVTLKTFGYPETLVKEYKHWAILVRLPQVTIGSLVLVNKSQETRLGNLSKDAWAEFSEVTRFAEQLLTRVFGAEKFNYLALMMRDPNVHFHLVPRYSKRVLLNGREYKDPDWPLKTQLEPISIKETDIELVKTKMIVEAKKL